MKPEILLKAYIQYQSEEAFRELVAGTLDEVYSAALRITQETPRLADEIALTAYLELARKAPRLSKDQDLMLATWLRERTCKIAVRILRTEERIIDWAVVKKEKNAHSTPGEVQSAPPGLAIRICQNVFLGAARHRRYGFLSPRVWWPTWIRPMHIGGVAICVVVIVVWRSDPFHQHIPIVRTQGVPMTPSSFAQLASPEELPVHMANTNAVTNTTLK